MTMVVQVMLCEGGGDFVRALMIFVMVVVAVVLRVFDEA